MAKYQRKSKGKAINPTFFVFCEGESEDAYISFLRSRFRVPIEIISKIAGYRITWNYINNTLRHRPGHPKDKLFLLYDLDAPGLMEKLGAIKGAGLLLSNPCFEFWPHGCKFRGIQDFPENPVVTSFLKIIREVEQPIINILIFACLFKKQVILCRGRKRVKPAAD